MSKKMRMTNDERYADWLLTHPDFDTQSHLPKLPQTQQFLNQIWPLAIEYWNPLNALFLSQCLSLEILGQRRTWFVRDGLVPLLYFFRTFPKPGRLKCRLFIEENLAGVVPYAWLENFGTYKIISKNGSRGPAKKLIVCGIASPAFNPLGELKKVLVPESCRRWRKMEKSVFLPAKTSHHEPNPNFHFEFFSQLTSMLGSNWTTLNWPQLEMHDQFDEAELLVLDSGLICADTYFTHAILSKGAYSPARSRFKGGKYLSLSPFHGVMIQESVPKSARSRFDKNSGLELEHSLTQIIKSPANKDLPWSHLFGEWK